MVSSTELEVVFAVEGIPDRTVCGTVAFVDKLHHGDGGDQPGGGEFLVRAVFFNLQVFEIEPLGFERAEYLLDAPCSASGTFRRHPEILYRARPAVIEQMAEVQTRMIDAAANLVRPGGHLVFATCSLEPQEGEEIITAFLDRRDDYSIDAIALDIDGIDAEEAGWLRIVPTMLENHGGMDSFFICRLVRQG